MARIEGVGSSSSNNGDTHDPDESATATITVTNHMPDSITLAPPTGGEPFFFVRVGADSSLPIEPSSNPLPTGPRTLAAGESFDITLRLPRSLPRPGGAFDFMPDVGRDHRGETQVTTPNSPDQSHKQLRELARPLRRGLSALRRRVRSLLLVLGVSRSVAVLATALLLFFVLDYTLRLPLWVRGCLLVATIGTTAVVAIRRLLTPLARKITDETLASHVEAAHPELEDRLRSSLAFAAGPIDDPDNEDSPELMRTVVEQTIEQTRSLRFAEVARSNIPIRWATAAAALAGILLLGSAARADLAGTFIKRSLLLQDVSWPRRTTLAVVDMTPGVPRPVTRGRETTIVVRAEGSIPDRVEFRYWETGSDPTSGERVELTPAAEDRGRFAITLPVYKSYEFTIRGGDDDREPIYEIQALRRRRSTSSRWTSPTRPISANRTRRWSAATNGCRPARS